MREKIDKYNAIMRDLYELLPHLPFAFKNEEEARTNAANAIRELRQYTERLRRIMDDEQPPIEVHSLTDAMKLNKDELAFLAWQFFQWINSDEGCPADKCKDFPCKYRRKIKEVCEESLQNGDIDAETMKEQHDNGYFACYCDEDGIGCWAEYYLWCYRNGVNPLNGKKEAK